MSFDEHTVPSKERDIQQMLLPAIATDLLLLERISNYNRLVRIIVWTLWFVNNGKQSNERDSCPILTLLELKHAKELWWWITQRSAFLSEICGLGQQGLLHVGGWLHNAGMPFSECHPVLLPGYHRITELAITAKNLCLLHAGPTLVSTSLSCQFAILGWGASNLYPHQPLCNMQEGRLKASTPNSGLVACVPG